MRPSNPGTGAFVQWIRAWAVSALLCTLVPALSGCRAGDTAPGVAPRLALGRDVCATCGMTVSDAGFAAALRRPDGTVIPFDSIECLIMKLRDPQNPATGTVWLSDRSGGGLHPETSMTVVLAHYPSPMGKGYAAFLDPGFARSQAEARNGIAGPLKGFVDGSLRMRGAR